MPKAGLEPARLSAMDFESIVATITPLGLLKVGVIRASLTVYDYNVITAYLEFMCAPFDYPDRNSRCFLSASSQEPRQPARTELVPA